LCAVDFGFGVGFEFGFGFSGKSSSPLTPNPKFKGTQAKAYATNS
jgi:hypothetical protein